MFLGQKNFQPKFPWAKKKFRHNFLGPKKIRKQFFWAKKNSDTFFLGGKKFGHNFFGLIKLVSLIHLINLI